jgi:GAF domain-containing protein
MKEEHGAKSTTEENLRELHGALLSTEGVEEFLHETAVLAAGLVRGGLSCGMTIQPDGKPVRIEDTAEKARWPEFEAQAASHGIRSCLALPLSTDGKPVGALNLYAREASAFGTAEARLAENFAHNASGALSLAIRLASHAALIEQLRSSLASRGVIDQALGIIMAREHCTQERAFAILRSASQNSNVKLRDIASAVVTSVTGEPPQPPPPFEEG